MEQKNKNIHKILKRRNKRFQLEYKKKKEILARIYNIIKLKLKFIINIIYH